jgi:LuxR family maltose regulon positive regulatory protein
MAEGIAERAERVDRAAVVLDAKLVVPPAPPMAIQRPRLTAMLDRAVRHRLTLVTGPPGTGKTVLVSEWARTISHTVPTGPSRRRRTTGSVAVRRAVAWVSLDDLDRGPARLWAHLMAALRPGADAGASLEAVAALANRSPRPLIVVLDGAERLGPAAIGALTALLDCRLPMLRLVVTARVPPSLPLDRLRLSGDLAEIGVDDLALTTAELVRLCTRHGRSLTAPAADALWARTEGWPGAVVLAAKAAKDDAEPMADLVRTEILAPSPPDRRVFLLRLSIVDDVTVPLARAMTGPTGVAHLDAVRRAGLLVPTPTGTLRWRVPVRDALRAEAERVIPTELPELHRRAARWHAANDRAPAALRHASASGDWRLAAGLTVRLAAPLLLGPDRPALAGLLVQLPTVDSDLDVAVARAVGAAAVGDRSGVAARAALVSSLRDHGSRAALALSELVAARRTEDVSAMASAAVALTGVLDGAAPGLVPYAGHLRAAALETLGTARLWLGDAAEARRLLASAAVAAEQLGLGAVAAQACAGLAMLHCVRGRLREAEELARSAAELAGDEPPPYLAALVTGLVRALAGDIAAAHRHATRPPVAGPSGAALAALRAQLWLRRAGGPDVAAARAELGAVRLGAGPTPLVRDWLALAEAELHVAEGRPVQALTVLADIGYGDDAALGGLARIGAARAYLASAAPARALSLLEPVPEWRDVGPWIRVEVALTRALAAEALGHDGTVAIAIAEAVATAGPDRITGPFLAAGPDLRALLDRHRETVDSALPGVRAWIVTPRAPAAVVEAITVRESIVLRYLPTLLTTEDIARELSISPNTVKSHLRHLYRKLAVGSRRDAVRQARRLGLLGA